MTSDEAFTVVRRDRPQLVHVSGKTSTGKSTFAQQLSAELGYAIIALDEVVYSAVIDAFDLKNAGEVFVEVYKDRQQADWIQAFLTASREKIQTSLAAGKPVVVDGAVVNPDTLKELFAGFPAATILYFHFDALPPYERNLTSRFMLSTSTDLAGLPASFRRLIDPAALDQFYKDRQLTDDLKQVIHQYAQKAQVSSAERLAFMRRHFDAIQVVHIQ